MMRLCFPDVKWELNRSDWFVDFPRNGSRILYGGLDDKERTEKILGQEHSTIFLNECSQIPYSARNKAVTRLAQTSGLALKAYYDCNPPSQGHWTYKIWAKGLEPTSGAKLHDPSRYATMQLNPRDNLDNLPAAYVAELEALPPKDRIRFLEGEFLPEVEGALWSYDTLERNRIESDDVPESLQRVVVSVDPSGCSGPEDERSDEIGITVCGADKKRIGYVLDDKSGHYSPHQWASIAVRLYHSWRADAIVAERNFGGAMVESTIKSVDPRVPVKLVTASRGKVQRAEPVAALYDQDRVKHVGIFPELEDQLCQFSSSGYMGGKSPDRADAVIWGLSDCGLFGARSYGMLEVA
jgi:hypothetical protein